MTSFPFSPFNHPSPSVRLPLTGQRLVHAQGILETLTLVALRIKVFRILQQEPPHPFENILFHQVRGFPIQIPSELCQLLIEELDHVEISKTGFEQMKPPLYRLNTCPRGIRSRQPYWEHSNVVGSCSTPKMISPPEKSVRTYPMPRPRMANP